jgi:hypothetical protein
MIYTKKYKKEKNKTKHKNKNKNRMIKRNTKNKKRNTHKIGGMMAGLANSIKTGDAKGGIDGALKSASSGDATQGIAGALQKGVQSSIGDSLKKTSTTEKLFSFFAGINKLNANPAYKAMIKKLLNRLYGNSQYFLNATKAIAPKQIDLTCITKYDADPTNINNKIIPYYKKLCILIKRYYDPQILDSPIFLDNSLSIDDIDKKFYLMRKKNKLYSKHSRTDHTQDLIKLLSDSEFRKKLDLLFEEHSKIPDTDPNANTETLNGDSKVAQPTQTKQGITGLKAKNPMGTSGIFTSGLLSSLSSPHQTGGPSSSSSFDTSLFFSGGNVSTNLSRGGSNTNSNLKNPLLNGVNPANLASNKMSNLGLAANNDVMHNNLEQLFIKEIIMDECNKVVTDVPNNQPQNNDCPPKNKSVKKTIDQSYLILAILYSMHDKDKKNPFYIDIKIMYNGLDIPQPGVFSILNK